MSAAAKALLSAVSPPGSLARLMIFPYHRFVRQRDPLSPNSPTAERFERQLRWIRRYCNPLPLSQAVERLRAGSLPARAVSLTFDDGYENNLSIAAPLLKQYGIPATVFIAVDAVERGIMWNDLIIEAVRAAGDEIDASACDMEDRIAIDDSNRLAVAQRLIAAVQYRPTAERLSVAEALHATTAKTPAARQMLTTAQLRELANFGIEIGAHTVNHPILKSLDDAAARREIDDSRRWLRDVTGVEPVLFAYPNGKRDYDYDERHAQMVNELGFRAAVASDWGCATRKSPLFELPRFKPWEDTEAGFSLRLCKTVGKTWLSRGSGA